MVKNWRVILGNAVLLVACGAAWAEQPAHGAAPFTDDARLQQKVTLHGLGVPIREVVQRISEATGVKVGAGPEAESLKVVVLVDDIPAQRVLRALAGGFGLQIRKYESTTKGDPPRAYSLLRTQADREEEKRLRDADDQAFRKRLDTWDAVGRASPDKWAEVMMATDPLANDGRAYSAAGLPVQVLAKAVVGLSDAQKAQICQGAKVRRRISDLPAEVRKTFVGELCKNLAFRLRRRLPQEVPDNASGVPEEALSDAQLVLWADSGELLTKRPLHVRVTGVKQMAPVGEAVPVAANRKEWETASYRFGADGPTGVTVTLGPSDLAAAKQAREAAAGPFDPPFSTKLGQVRLVDGRYGAMPSAILWQLHQVTKAPIIAGFHAARMGMLVTLPLETLGDALDLYQVCFRATWKPVAGIHTLRSKSWYLDDSLEIPVERLRAWRAQAATDKVTSPALFDELAQLPQMVLGRLSGYGALDVGALLSESADGLDLIRLWASFAPEQRQQAAADGIRLGDLSPAQYALLSDSEGLDANPDHTLRTKLGDQQMSVTIGGPDGAVSQVTIDLKLSSSWVGKRLKGDPPPDLYWALDHEGTMPEEEARKGAPRAPGR